MHVFFCVPPAEFFSGLLYGTKRKAETHFGFQEHVPETKLPPPKSHPNFNPTQNSNQNPKNQLNSTKPRLEDHPRTCKWLGSPSFISHRKAIWKGSHNPILRRQALTMVANHLLKGMILQVVIKPICAIGLINSN